MDGRTTAEHTRREIVRLCHAGLDATTLRQAVFARLRTAIPFDAYWCTTVDPATFLFTGAVMEGIPERTIAALIANEFMQDDVNKFVHLARSDQPVNTLYAGSAGKPAESTRYREILRPLGYGNEIRAVLLAGGLCWGAVCLHREAERPGFTPAEVAFVSQLTPHLAEGLRTALLLADVGGADTVVAGWDGPGLIVLADDLSVAATTPTAERWLAELNDWPRAEALPQAIHAVVARLRVLEHAGEALPESMPRARLRTRAGQWLVLHAARLAGPDAKGQTAVILERAQPAEVAPLILQAYNLTEQEGRIAQLVLRGHATSELVDALSISALTVQQHLKAVFDKTGVHSRRELVARIFAQQYVPRIRSGARVGADGWFDTDARRRS